MDFKKMDIDYIIDWCKSNNQVEWLKATAAKKITHNIYPKKTYINKKGKEVTKQDKSQEPIGTETKDISFVELKMEFCKKFMPELVPVSTKEKKPSMFDKIAAL